MGEQIDTRFLENKWAKEDAKIRLRLAKGDNEALTKLFNDVEDYDKNSNLTINYNLFCNLLLREEISIDELYRAIHKLEVILITLEQNDNAQLIFESLNSTGLALTEGDKIRNYILMGLQPQEQTSYYDKYWAKIEKCTANDVSAFARDYLSIKTQKTPVIDNTYRDFKRYAQETELPLEKLLEDLLRYARLYEKLLVCKSGFTDVKVKDKVDDCLYRLRHLEVVIVRPFFMEVLRLAQEQKLKEADVLQIFLLTESFLFRRNICDVATNSLNKIFLNLNKEIIRYDNTTEHYFDKMIYALRSKQESGRFPDDEEFSKALATKQVYQMRGKFKAYLFERFENYGTIENKEVYKQLDKNVYSIEHIMPQHLTPAWKEALGQDAEEIHKQWLHRLANLTLTGYNSSLSNKTFQEKRDAEDGGYKNSGLKMSLKISYKDSWGVPELEERNDEMVTLAKKIWAYPNTTFKPVEKEFASCGLDDEDIDLTGRNIVKYSYQNVEQPASSWIDMFEHIVRFLHQKDRSILTDIVYGTSSAFTLQGYFSKDGNGLRTPLRIDDAVYVEKNTSTILKLNILRRLFPLYGADPMDLVFYLRDEDSDKQAAAVMSDLRRGYWVEALPEIQKENSHWGIFGNATPNKGDTLNGFIGIHGFKIQCIINYDKARLVFYMGNNDTAKNKATYDMLISHKQEIEQSFGYALNWDRAENNKASWLSYEFKGVSLHNKDDWKSMINFHAKLSRKLCEVLLPYLYAGESSNELRMMDIAGYAREWVETKAGYHCHLENCTTYYTRFTSAAMTGFLPDLQDALSGWGTDNHYFYEAINKDGNSLFIKFVINGDNITPEFRRLCDWINEFYPTKMQRDDWRWRTHYKTQAFQIGEVYTKEEIFQALDACLEEIKAFEQDVITKVKEAIASGQQLPSKNKTSIII